MDFVVKFNNQFVGVSAENIYQDDNFEHECRCDLKRLYSEMNGLELSDIWVYTKKEFEDLWEVNVEFTDINQVA